MNNTEAEQRTLTPRDFIEALKSNQLPPLPRESLEDQHTQRVYVATARLLGENNDTISFRFSGIADRVTLPDSLIGTIEVLDVADSSGNVPVKVTLQQPTNPADALICQLLDGNSPSVSLENGIGRYLRDVQIVTPDGRMLYAYHPSFNNDPTFFRIGFIARPSSTNTYYWWRLHEGSAFQFTYPAEDRLNTPFPANGVWLTWHRFLGNILCRPNPPERSGALFLVDPWRDGVALKHPYSSRPDYLCVTGNELRVTNELTSDTVFRLVDR